MAFTTFFADRTTPEVMLSDNAAQFHLIATYLPDFWTAFVNTNPAKDHLFEKDIKWHFTPAKAPWYGGVYERLIGVIKTSYIRAHGHGPLHILTFQQAIKSLQTMVNERPLCPAEESSGQLALTPAHFLHGHFGSLAPRLERPADDGTITARRMISMWKADSEYQNRLWQTWKQQYIVFLRDKIPQALPNAYRTTPYKPAVNDIVVVQDAQTTPGKYKLARITALPVSADGQIRHAEIKFPSGKDSSRPLKFLAPLELESAPRPKLGADQVDHQATLDH